MPRPRTSRSGQLAPDLSASDSWAVYQDRPEDAVNQGDLFADVAFRVPTMDDLQPMLGLVISHDCDCDKFLRPRSPLSATEHDAFSITVAPVHPISLLTEGRPKAARAGKMSRYFYLPAENGEEELVADLWLEQPIRMVDLLESQRRQSLSDESRRRLWTQIFALRIRLNPDEVFVDGELRAS